MQARTGRRRVQPVEGVQAHGRPVVLATMGVPFEPEAAVFAVDSAVESGQRLVVVNVTRLEPLSLSVRLGYDALEEFTPDVSESLRRAAETAASLGVDVERLRVRSPRPVTALLEVVAERRPGLLVFGPDRRAMGSRTYARAVAKIRDADPCLLWLAPEA